MAPTIYFVRHGETDWNAEGRLQGQRDTSLNDRGRRQADEVGRFLPDLVPGFAELDYVASPLSRTRETMERLRAAAGLPVDDFRRDERLREVSFGIWEGMTWKEVRSRDNAGAAARDKDRFGFMPRNGESYVMVVERLRPFIVDITRDTLVVSHGGVARALLTMLTDLSTAEAPSVPIWQGRVLVFRDGAAHWTPES
ncbi:MAG: histidine phosphatase family protein [Chelatococcus sp.]|uniref:histidine phosphatase family protein n=1 Tax=Chelatococcus sp. TaxID=1953771 RepID=UPI0025C0C5FA|nr:histidine phosphatase family protein [Chelatococcus sp.]MBX3536487.1 histidine phosphatase family protein [Chelatococcus sp.]